jgi:nucleotide-binding universal stress UspA family protein
MASCPCWKLTTRPRSEETKVPEQQVGKGHRIVAGVDGSASSVEALRWAVWQAELTGGTVDAVMAWQPPAASGLAWGVSMADETDYEKIAAKVLADAVGQAVGVGSKVRVRPVVAEGNAAEVLLDAAAGADLLVVGCRGHGGFARALLGSVSQHCTHHSRCPVVVIRGLDER